MQLQGRRQVRFASAMAMALAPMTSAACPYCIRRGQGHGSLYVLALLVLLPYGVTLAATRVISRLSRLSSDDQAPNHEPNH